jgi:regulator of cell morphogenesis and NO signaling
MMNPAALPDEALVAHMVEHHHAYVRRALPWIVPLLAKITGSHRRRNQKLAALCDAGQELAEALEAHLEQEERDLFPELLAGGSDDVDRQALSQVHRKHRELGLLLARIRWLADDYDAPPWAGRSYQLLMEELRALEEDVKEQLHIETHVLIPRLTSRRGEPS